MPKNKLLVIANWKMNPDSPGRAIRMAKEIERKISNVKNAEVIIAPPFPFLYEVGRKLKKSKLGAQDMFWADLGPYTGAVSWHQLRHLRVHYAIIGHSERRRHFGETDAVINKKLDSALKAGIIPILAVGEDKKISGKKMRAVLYRQLSHGLSGISEKMFGKGVIAYEPIWAIGTGRAATPKHAKIALGMIQKILSQLWKTKTASTPIIYGGSVNAKNAASYVSVRGGGMHGMLIGGASLKPSEFAAIVNSSAKKYG